MVFPSKEDRDRVCREYGAVDGGIQHVANLAAYLAPGSDAVSNVLTIALPNEHDIIFSRNFDAPRDLVWKAMTDPDMLRQWVFLPPGWEMTMCEDEHRVDGSFRREWKHPHGDMAVHGTYAEFQPPERLVRSEIFDMGCDAPMADEIATLVLTELATERGTITNMHMTFRYTSQAARDGALKSGMDRGMEAGYRNLDGLFAETHHARG
ncbi:MAG: SRPBCC domain-containing protein [Phycisphaeraceae bacterium]|nr:SRPBCC domain-containing protein [Phycisphaeraceae bacterium]